MAAPSIALSSDGTYLVDQSGAPVFINGDTAWSLMAQPTNAQVQAYLDDRQEKGYNVIIVSLIEALFADNAPANVLGDRPFTGAPFATPNEAYFARADWIIEQAAARGISLLLAPAYLGYACGGEGWCRRIQEASFETMHSYGRFLGNRYKDHPNIIWLIGGDTDPFMYNVDEKLEEMVAGIKEFDPDHLMTAHTGPETSAQEIWGSRAWLDLNTVYTYSGRTYEQTAVEYRRENALPLFLLETAYENEHGSTPLSLRASAYHSVLWGARLGHFFGNCPIWPFGTSMAAKFCEGTDWVAQLDSAGSTTVAYIGNLMRSRRHWLMRPDHEDTVMTRGHGRGSTRAVTARASDGSSVIAYIPTRRRVTMDMTEVAGSTAQVWWWNPRTNVATSVGAFPTTGSQTFTPPDNNDWVLVIDDASQNFSPPGGAFTTSALTPSTNLAAE
ncbi:MAG TPA: glycoside hydrolase family 140 protein [Rhodothermales bacterium]